MVKGTVDGYTVEMEEYNAHLSDDGVIVTVYDAHGTIREQWDVVNYAHLADCWSC